MKKYIANSTILALQIVIRNLFLKDFVAFLRVIKGDLLLTA